MFARPASAVAAPARHRLSLLALASRLFAARSLARQRARLRLLDDHLLSDIGVTRAEAEAECARPHWDSPAHWRG